MNVLSLFDGMSCGRIALDRAGIPVTNYFASEVDTYAIKVAKKNYPDTKHVGDVSLLTGEGLPTIDLLIGGSPCQGFSLAGKQLNFEDPRSKLFFEYVRLLKECKPKYFLLENVKMKKEYQNIISEQLGVEPIEINSSLVSAQNRKRLYWTNIPNVSQPDDKGILLKDILESGIAYRDKSHCIISSIGSPTDREYFKKSQGQLVAEEVHAVKKGGQFVEKGDKSMCLDANYFKGPDNHGQRSLVIFRGKTESEIRDKISEYTKREFTFSISENGHIRPHRFDKKMSGISEIGTIRDIDGKSVAIIASHVPKIHTGEYDTFLIRKLTPIECERLQTLPDNYTEGVSNSQRYKMIGNGWTVDVIAHILRNINH